MELGLMPGKYPAIVRSYDQGRRTCRIDIPGLTDGGSGLPEAEIEYSIGDKSRAGQFETEIEILAGDTVWIEFIGGDPRYPIITGYRNPQSGNSVDWRRWHHKNMELLATTLMRLIAGGDILIKSDTKITFQAPLIISDSPSTTCTGNHTINKALSVQDADGTGSAMVGNFELIGNINQTGDFNLLGNAYLIGSITCNGKNIGDTHSHPDMTSGGNTGTVN